MASTARWQIWSQLEARVVGVVEHEMPGIGALREHAKQLHLAGSWDDEFTHSCYCIRRLGQTMTQSINQSGIGGAVLANCRLTLATFSSTCKMRPFA